MAAPLPAKLRTPEIQRFAKRAAQLEKFRPIVTYWCEYYILQQILSKQLHMADEETSSYAVQLMDKLENVKSESANNDAIIDDVAAKAYVENFALETFNRADEAQRSEKVSIQTADTFQAASTFMDLLSIWGDLDVEISAKVKFAKFHAMRIVKAVKAGEDPNASNPVIEKPAPPGDEGLEAELKELEQQGEVGAQNTYRMPTVDAVPDDAGAHTGTHGDPQATAESLSTMPTSATAPVGEMTDASSPQNLTQEAARKGSIGGGYFPAVTSASSAEEDGGMADTDAMQPGNVPWQHTEHSQDSTRPQDFYNQANISTPAPTTHAGPPDPLPHVQNTAQPPTVESSPRLSSAPAAPPAPAPIFAAPTHLTPPAGAFKTDDESAMAAQKHAKWAISALNFEDVNTAVKELRLALQSLGAA